MMWTLHCTEEYNINYNYKVSSRPSPCWPSYSLPGGAVPGKAAWGTPALEAAACWPGIEYWGRNWAKFVPKAAGSCPPWKPLGNCWLAEISLWSPVAEVTRRLRMLLSDICSLWATGGIRARLAGSLDTSDFMSERSSSSWLRTCKSQDVKPTGQEGGRIFSPCAAPRWRACYRPGFP